MEDQKNLTIFVLAYLLLEKRKGLRGELKALGDKIRSLKSRSTLGKAQLLLEIGVVSSNVGGGSRQSGPRKRGRGGSF